MGKRGNFVAALLLATAGTPIWAQDADPLASANAATVRGDAEAAYRILKPLEDSRAGDPRFDYALGVAAADTKRVGEALIALQRVLAVEPTNALARAEIARVYALSGDIDTARAEFDTVVGDPTVPDPVRQRFTRLIRGFDRQIAGGATDVSGFIDIEGGYDSNINAATDLSSIVFPALAFLGPAALAGGAVEQDDAFAQVQGGVSLSTPLSRQTRLIASGLGSWRDNLSSGFVDQGSLVGSLGLAHTLANRDAISLSGQAQLLTLDGDRYRTASGATVRYTKRLAADRALSFSADWFRLDYRNAPLLDADRYGASVTYAGPVLLIGGGAGREETVRPGADQLSYTFVSGQVGAEQPLNDKLALLSGLSLEYRNHDGQDPLFLTGRRDWRLDASIGLRMLLSDRLSVRPRVTWTRNDSNLKLYDYDRVTASAALRFEF